LHNKFVIPEFYGSVRPEVMYKLTYEDEFEKNIERQNDNMDLDKKVITINEVRTKRGMKPVSWGDEPYEGKSGMSESFVRDKKETAAVSDNKKKALFKQFGDNISKDIFGGLSISELRNIVENGSKEMREVASDVLLDFEQRTSKGVSPDELDYNGLETFVDSTFNEIIIGFKKNLLVHSNEINNGIVSGVLASMSIPLALLLFNSEKGVRSSVKGFVKNGIEIAEEQSNTNLMFNTNVDSFVDDFSNQVVNGYTLPDGEQWIGLKGVGKELSSKVEKIISDGVREGKSINFIRDRLVEEASFSKKRALLIARNESIRISNESQFESLKQNNFKGNKVFLATIDNRTSDICRRMNGTTVPFDSPFVDSKTGLRSNSGKMHVNCRSTFYLEPLKEKEEEV